MNDKPILRTPSCSAELGSFWPGSQHQRPSVCLARPYVTSSPTIFPELTKCYYCTLLHTTHKVCSWALRDPHASCFHSCLNSASTQVILSHQTPLLHSSRSTAEQLKRQPRHHTETSLKQDLTMPCDFRLLFLLCRYLTLSMTFQSTHAHPVQMGSLPQPPEAKCDPKLSTPSQVQVPPLMRRPQHRVRWW